MKKKNRFLVVIILIAALLIAIVFWIYAKRIEHIENKIKIQSISIRATSGGKTFTTLSMIPPIDQPICG
jgi:YbbR domain-containing protein